MSKSAFPHPGTYKTNGDWLVPPTPGITMRDYFASQALDGLMRSIPSRTGQNYSWFDDMASSAYKIADAMLKARETTDESP